MRPKTVLELRQAEVKRQLAAIPSAAFRNVTRCDNCDDKCDDTHEIRVRYDAFRYEKSIEVCLKCRDKLCYEDTAAVEVL